MACRDIYSRGVIVMVHQVMGDSDHEDDDILVDFEDDVVDDDAFVTVVPRPLSSAKASTVSVSASAASASVEEEDDDDWEVIDRKSVPVPQVARAARGTLPHNASDVVGNEEAGVVDWVAAKLRAGAQWMWPWISPVCARVQVFWPDFEQMINRTSWMVMAVVLVSGGVLT